MKDKIAEISAILGDSGCSGHSSKGNRIKECYIEIKQKEAEISRLERITMDEIKSENQIKSYSIQIVRLLEDIMKLRRERFLLICEEAIKKNNKENVTTNAESNEE